MAHTTNRCTQRRQGPMRLPCHRSRPRSCQLSARERSSREASTRAVARTRALTLASSMGLPLEAATAVIRGGRGHSPTVSMGLVPTLQSSKSRAQEPASTPAPTNYLHAAIPTKQCPLQATSRSRASLSSIPPLVARARAFTPQLSPRGGRPPKAVPTLQGARRTS